MKLVKESLSPSGAVYGFAGWLTTRKDPVIMSSHHDAAIVAELVDEFCKKQKLESPKDHWEDDLIPMNESLAYTNFFGKQVSHEDALHSRIRDLISNIVMEERGISEKAFSSVDNVMAEVKNVCETNPEIYEEAQKFYDKRIRLEGLAEQIYQKYFVKEKEAF